MYKNVMKKQKKMKYTSYFVCTYQKKKEGITVILGYSPRHWRMAQNM